MSGGLRRRLYALSFVDGLLVALLALVATGILLIAWLPDRRRGGMGR